MHKKFAIGDSVLLKIIQRMDFSLFYLFFSTTSFRGFINETNCVYLTLKFHMYHTKTIVLIDPFLGGHHQSFLQLYADCLLRDGHRVIVVCPHNNRIHDYFEKNQPENLGGLKTVPFSRWVLLFQDGVLIGLQRMLKAVLQLIIIPLQVLMAITQIVTAIYQIILNRPVSLNGLFMVEKYIDRVPAFAEWGMAPFRVLIHWVYAGLIVKRITNKEGSSPDLVFFCWLDTYIIHSKLVKRITDRAFQYDWAGLFFHPTKTNLSSYKSETMLGSHHCTQIAFLNEYAALDFQSFFEKEKIVIFPDSIDETPPDQNYGVVNEIKHLAGNRKIIGILGSLENRKGVITLLMASQQSQEMPWFFVFCGEPIISTFTIREWLLLMQNSKTKTGNTFFLLNEIPDEPKFNALINTCDVIFAAYLDFKGSSNLLTKAAFFKKPVIVSAGTCMGNRVEKYKTGVVINQGNVKECIGAIQELTSSYKSKVNNKNYFSYYQDHSHDRLVQAWRYLLRTGELAKVKRIEKNQ